MNNCVFCAIIKGELPSEKVFENDDLLAIKDIKPQAPVHILVLTKKHISGVDAINGENSEICAKAFEAIAQIAKSFHLDSGYRVITNVGEDGGQTIRHLHFHILGGVKMSERVIEQK